MEPDLHTEEKEGTELQTHSSKYMGGGVKIKPVRSIKQKLRKLRSKYIRWEGIKISQSDISNINTCLELASE
jgi:hypothetical protein